MRCDYFMFLLVQTNKDGQTKIIDSSDKEEEIEEAFLYWSKADREEIEAGSLRYDIYKSF